MKNISILTTLLLLLCTTHSALSYYSPGTGRWLNRDPSEEAAFVINALGPSTPDLPCKDTEQLQSNCYAALENDLLRHVDPIGLWPSENHHFGIKLPVPLTHQGAIRRKTPPWAHRILSEMAVEMDTHQELSESFMHAMRAPWQSSSAAMIRADTLVRTEVTAAENDLCGCLPDINSALRHFGAALHTIQDATSPSHAGFLVWRGEGADPFGALRHVLAENFDPGPNSNLDNATGWLWTFFKCKTEAPQLPANFFTNLKPDRKP